MKFGRLTARKIEIDLTLLLPMQHTSSDIMSKRPFKFKYDFEIGYLVKSPCKKCIYHKIFPKCSDQCEILDKIHTVLAEAVSCSRRKS